MPTYEYRCQQCSTSLEAFHKMTDEPLKLCPNCGENSLQRGPGGGLGLIFKGSGFYKTEYAKTTATEVSEPKTSTAAAGECCPCGKKQSCSSN